MRLFFILLSCSDTEAAHSVCIFTFSLYFHIQFVFSHLFCLLGRDTKGVCVCVCVWLVVKGVLRLHHKVSTWPADSA